MSLNLHLGEKNYLCIKIEQQENFKTYIILWQK